MLIVRSCSGFAEVAENMFTEAGAALCDSAPRGCTFQSCEPNHLAKIAESFTAEAILDNVVGLGELVLQFYALCVDRRFVRFVFTMGRSQVSRLRSIRCRFCGRTDPCDDSAVHGSVWRQPVNADTDNSKVPRQDVGIWWDRFAQSSVATSPAKQSSRQL